MADINTPYPSHLQTITHISAAGDFVIQTGACVLWGFTSNNTAKQAVLTVYDGVDNTGDVIGAFDITTVYSMSFPGGGLYLRTGLYVEVTTAADLTFISASLIGG